MIVDCGWRIVAGLLLAMMGSGCGAMIDRILMPAPPSQSMTIYYKPRDWISPWSTDESSPTLPVDQEICSILHRGRAEDALPIIEEALGAADINADQRQRLLFLKAIALAETFDINASLHMLDELIENDPSRWHFFFHRWQLRLLEGDEEGAQADRDAGMKLNPEQFSQSYSPTSGVF
jgi:hypothetical protein